MNPPHSLTHGNDQAEAKLFFKDAVEKSSTSCSGMDQVTYRVPSTFDILSTLAQGKQKCSKNCNP